MMEKYMDIGDVSKCFNNEWILSGAVSVSMIGGFTMFVGYLFGICIATLFMKIYTRFV